MLQVVAVRLRRRSWCERKTPALRAESRKQTRPLLLPLVPPLSRRKTYTSPTEEIGARALYEIDIVKALTDKDRVLAAVPTRVVNERTDVDDVGTQLAVVKRKRCVGRTSIAERHAVIGRHKLILVELSSSVH